MVLKSPEANWQVSKFTLLSGISYRPVATSLDDKVTLQDCLESGRQAKVNVIYFFILFFLLVMFSLGVVLG